MNDISLYDASPSVHTIKQKSMIRVLIIEDNEFDYQLLVNRLKRAQMEFEHQLTDNLDEFKQLLVSYKPDIVLSDFNLGSFTGFDTIQATKEYDPYLPIIVVTGRVNEETSVKCIKDGAWHYILKDNLMAVPVAMRNALEYVEEQRKKLKAWNALTMKNKKLIALNKELTVAKEKAEESTRLKTSFIKNISHEIRTPLNGIMGFISLLNSEEVFSDEYRMYFELIQKSGGELMNGMTNILNISLIEANQVKVNRQPVIVSQMVANIMYEYDPIIQAMPIQMNVDVRQLEQKAIKLDEKLVWEIIKQLLDNAIKFTPEGNIFLTLTEDNSQLIIKLEDTGIGIPAEQTTAIFKSFTTLPRNDGNIYRGNGLGLAVVKGFTDQLKGTVSVDSIEGKGSTFTVRIPI